MSFLLVGMLLGKILYPSGVAGTDMDVYYSYPPAAGKKYLQKIS